MMVIVASELTCSIVYPAHVYPANGSFRYIDYSERIPYLSYALLVATSYSNLGIDYQALHARANIAWGTILKDRIKNLAYSHSPNLPN
jgi:hypothetical protein